MENNPDRISVIARSRKQVARPHASRARCDPPISARRSPSSRHLAPINAHSRSSGGPLPLPSVHSPLLAHCALHQPTLSFIRYPIPFREAHNAIVTPPQRNCECPQAPRKAKLAEIVLAAVLLHRAPRSGVKEISDASVIQSGPYT
ncbi:hypothetical protein EVAR_9777_1 [Eumeta japonica]|uniref:Uncharacterized protein n=1 Tax=Eumeta variegata TaxID=151549 RepID=A0A4C1U5F8_EUMVA|nr:hypothetical protein EVAR_9777_1 [Eumeta japonica]